MSSPSIRLLRTFATVSGLAGMLLAVTVLRAGVQTHTTAPFRLSAEAIAAVIGACKDGALVVNLCKLGDDTIVE